MAESPTTNETVFYDQRLSNGLQIVGQPMPDFEIGSCLILRANWFA